MVEAFTVPAIFFGIAQPEDARVGRFYMEVARQLALGLPAVDVRRALACDEPPDALRQRFGGFTVKRRARAPVVESCYRATLRGADANVKLVRAEGAMIISRTGAKKGDPSLRLRA